MNDVEIGEVEFIFVKVTNDWKGRRVVQVATMYDESHLLPEQVDRLIDLLKYAKAKALRPAKEKNQ